jgi:DNA-binding GntR family transcriptional regulator
MNRNKKAYDYLSELILSGKLLPGESIIETEIAEELYTSRTPLREALKTLET